MDRIEKINAGDTILYWDDKERWVPGIVLWNRKYGFSYTMNIVNIRGRVFRMYIDHVSCDYIREVPPV